MLASLLYTALFLYRGDYIFIPSYQYFFIISAPIALIRCLSLHISQRRYRLTSLIYGTLALLLSVAYGVFVFNMRATHHPMEACADCPIYSAAWMQQIATIAAPLFVLAMVCDLIFYPIRHARTRTPR